MSLFRRKPRPPLLPEEDHLDSYAVAESNPELLAAEQEVNQQPSITRLFNPTDGSGRDEEVWVADDE